MDLMIQVGKRQARLSIVCLARRLVLAWWPHHEAVACCGCTADDSSTRRNLDLIRISVGLFALLCRDG